jgi:hypothetical protein
MDVACNIPTTYSNLKHFLILIKPFEIKSIKEALNQNNKKMKKIVFIAVILFFASALAVNAQRATPRVTGRQATQQVRIANGVQSGQLTRNETRRLERQQHCIQAEKRIAKADGTVTPRERRFLRREQNRASRNINRQKNDNQVQGGNK